MAGRRQRRWIGLGGGAAIVALASVFLFGPGHEREGATVEGDARAAYELSLSKAVAGDPQAQFETAERLRRGMGVARNPRKAAEWYRKAAARGHVDAVYAMGTLREKGDGVPRDDGRAADWYHLAASLGRHAEAEFALGQLYFHGRGVPADPGEAVSWYRRAAEDGHPAAQHVLGSMYESGWNVEADLIEAYKWFTLAIPKRHQAMAVDRGFDPLAARDALSKKMTRFQIARGQQAAAEWRPAKTPQPLGRDGVLLSATPAGSVPAANATLPKVAFRLFSFEAPIGSDRATHAALNLIVEFDEPSAGMSACGLTPRLRDAVFQDVWMQPLAEQPGPSALEALDDRLVPALNRVLGRQAVRRVFLRPGDRPLTANEILQTPFDAVEECAPPAAAG